jgi:hypothetical protein
MQLCGVAVIPNKEPWNNLSILGNLFLLADQEQKPSACRILLLPSSELVVLAKRKHTYSERRAIMRTRYPRFQVALGPKYRHMLIHLLALGG